MPDTTNPQAEPLADRAALRDRIAALFRCPPGAERLGDATPGEIADAVLAVLPEPADRTAILREVADICDEAGAVYASKELNDQAGVAYRLMERFLRKADEAEYVATPCSFGACEPGGEPCATHKRLMAHAEGDHERCEPDCGTSRVAGEAQQPETQADTRAAIVAELLPVWEAMYEPGNVSDYLIGYANSEAAAKGAAEAWLRSEKDEPGRLEWVPQTPLDGYDQESELIERHDDGIDTGPGITVRHRTQKPTA